MCVFRCHPVQQWLTDVFWIVYRQQWSSVAQRKEIHQALTRSHCLLVGSLNCRFWSFHGRISAALTFDVSYHFCHLSIFCETLLADEPDDAIYGIFKFVFFLFSLVPSYSFFFFFFFLGACCSAVLLPSEQCYFTWAPSTWQLVDNDWMFISGWTEPLNILLKELLFLVR